MQVPLVTLVGASNELPESEELDALYDRFLIRKEVKQVTAGGEGEHCGASTRGSTHGIVGQCFLLAAAGPDRGICRACYWL